MSRYFLFSAALGTALGLWLIPGPAAAQFVNPIAVTRLADIAFGKIASDSALSGSVTVDAATGAKTVSGAYDLGGVHSRAQFEVTGDANVAFTISLPASIALAAGAKSATIDNIASSPATTGVLDATGRADVFVGGRLVLTANQAAGAYSGSFSVTVNYQ